MTQDSNEKYAARYSEAIKQDCLYRVGTSLEIILCDGNGDLSQQEQERILLMAEDLLKGQSS